MGFWKTLGKVALGAASIAVPEIAPIAGAILGNETQKDATNKAVSQQQAAIDKAKAEQQAATDKAQTALDNPYNATRADLSPYLQGGGAAFSSLGQMVGLPASGGGGAMPMGQGGPQTIGALMQPQQGGGAQAPQAQARAPQAAQAQTGSSYVTMQAPDGSTEMVPHDHVGHFTQMGAKVVGENNQPRMAEVM